MRIHNTIDRSLGAWIGCCAHRCTESELDGVALQPWVRVRRSIFASEPQQVNYFTVELGCLLRWQKPDVLASHRFKLHCLDWCWDLHRYSGQIDTWRTFLTSTGLSPAGVGADSSLNPLQRSEFPVFFF
jgi:hypothetical protein